MKMAREKGISKSSAKKKCGMCRAEPVSSPQSNTEKRRVQAGQTTLIHEPGP